MSEAVQVAVIVGVFGLASAFVSGLFGRRIDLRVDRLSDTASQTRSPFRRRTLRYTALGFTGGAVFGLIGSLAAGLVSWGPLGEGGVATVQGRSRTLVPYVAASSTVARALTGTASVELVSTSAPNVTPKSAGPGKDVSAPLEVAPAVGVAYVDGETGLVVCLKDPDSRPYAGFRIQVFSQVDDVSGNPTYGDRASEGQTDQTGCAAFPLEAATYVAWMDNFRGYPWGNMDSFPGMSGLEVVSGQRTVLTINWGRLVLGLTRAEQPIEGQYVEVWTERADVAGNPVRASRAADGQTDNRGIFSTDLIPGRYVVYTDLRGYNWGDARDGEGEASVVVSAGETTTLLIRMGALFIERKDSDGNAAAGVYCELYTQTLDVSDKPALGARLETGNTDNTGRIGWPLTEGTYAVKVGELVEYDIPVEWGKNTYVDGAIVLRVE